jgi:hypothetical protein
MWFYTNRSENAYLQIFRAAYAQLRSTFLRTRRITAKVPPTITVK